MVDVALLILQLPDPPLQVERANLLKIGHMNRGTIVL